MKPVLEQTNPAATWRLSVMVSETERVSVEIVTVHVEGSRPVRARLLASERRIGAVWHQTAQPLTIDIRVKTLRQLDSNHPRYELAHTLSRMLDQLSELVELKMPSIDEFVGLPPRH